MVHTNSDAFENRSRDNAGEARTANCNERMDGTILRTPAIPKIFIRRNQSEKRQSRKHELADGDKPTAATNRPKPDFDFILSSRRSVFQEICVFDLLPVEITIDYDRRWSQIWDALIAEDDIHIE